MKGKAAFDARYEPEFVPPEGVLRTIDDLKLALDKIGQTYPKSAKNDALVAIAANAGLPAFDILRRDYDEANHGRVQLARQGISQDRIAAAMIERHPGLCGCSAGGSPKSTSWRHLQS